MRRPIGAVPALAVIVASCLIATGSPAAGVPARGADIKLLFDRALATVRANREFAKAVMLEADGSPTGNGAVRGAARITRWRFVLANRGGSRFASVTIDYRRASGFAAPVGHPEPFLEDVVIKRAPKLTLAEAVSRLRRAGYRRPFSNVTLRNPLGPERSQALYIFGLDRKGFVAVNSRTGAVDPIS